MKAALPLVACLVLAACDDVRTLRFRLVFPPGTDRLPTATTTVRVTLDAPPRTLEAPVDAEGRFQLALELPADGTESRLTLEALDAAGDTLAVARAAPLPLAGLDDVLALYVSPPGAFAEAPVALDPPRSALGAAALPYGVVLAGGAAAGGAATDDLVIYNVNRHVLQVGAPLPAPRAGALVMATGDGLVHVVGGAATLGGEPTGTIWAFNTLVAPAGRWVERAAAPGFARAFGEAAPLGDDFVLAGGPPGRFDPRTGEGLRLSLAEAEPPTTATRLGNDKVLLFGAGLSCVVSAGIDDCTPSAAFPPPRRGHAAVRLPDGRVLLVGGAALDDTPITAFEGLDADLQPVLPGASLPSPRLHPAAVVTRGLLVVIGGFDGSGAALPDALIYDLATFTLVRSVPLVAPRGAAQAFVLPNDAILLVGGRDAPAATTASPIGTIEIFQP